MRWLAVVLTALVLSAPALAGGAKLTLPAPSIGSTKIEEFSIKATTRPKIVATNLAALGKGFGAAGVIGKSAKTPGTYLVYVVMFMGNLSTAPASTVSLQVTGGTPSGAPKDVTKSCEVVKSIFDGSYRELVGATVAIFGLMEDRGSKTGTFLRNTISYQKQSLGCP